MFLNNKLSEIMFWEMKNIKRYSTRPAKFFSENNSEHSYMAIIIAIRLGIKLSLSESEQLELIKMTAFHDAGELITGDINSLCKTPTLNKELEKIEKPLYDRLEDYFCYKNEKSGKLYYLVKAADLLCVKFFGDINEDKELSEQGFKLFKFYLRKARKCDLLQKKKS